MKWKDKLLKKLAVELTIDTEWNNYIEQLKCDYPSVGVHLAVFSEPILSELLAGRKTVESRFSTNKVGPFGKIQAGDIILVKKSGGPVVGAFLAGTITSFSNLTPSKMRAIRSEYSTRLGLPEKSKFWSEKLDAKYGTLISIKKFKQLSPYPIEKKDRTGWVVLQERSMNDLFIQS